MSLRPGHTRVLGAHVEPGGVNFALAAPNAHAVDLCLFDQAHTQVRCLPMPQQTHGIWHGFLPDAAVGQLYGWRVHGPWNPLAGQRFNPAKVLLDPFAREVVGVYGGEDIHQGHQSAAPLLADGRDNAATALKARVVADLPMATRCTPVAAQRRVLYELHVKGFTACHPEVPPDLRGSYAGLAHPASVRYLKALGVTTLCLMPVAHRADEARLLRLGLRNYWGYNPVAWNAPEARYWSGTAGTTSRGEFRAMVNALHAADLEVVLDVVYNHTAESDELGPTLSLRGIDNACYYQLDAHHPQHYLNATGCGNSVNLNHPLVLRTVMDSLRGWVQEFGVDGFRFDLAPVLARGTASTGHAFSPHAPFLMAVAQDPLLRDCLLVAEPWDVGHGGYQLGQFPGNWLEWNDRFRDTQRGYWLHRQGHLGALAHRMAGSTDAFDPAQRSACSSVNFVTAHDGFTLTDLVSYQERHNQANGENNRDGHGYNLSANHGVEGPSSDPAITALRLQKKRALLAMALFSLGTPMLLAGDEMGHSQGGNNNAYCQDNATTWLDWSAADTELQTFVRHLLALRHQHVALQAQHWWGQGAHSALQALWLCPDGSPMQHAHWHDIQNRALALHLLPASFPNDAACLLLLNASAHDVRFTLPAGNWVRQMDSGSGSTSAMPLERTAQVSAASVWLATSASTTPSTTT